MSEWPPTDPGARPGGASAAAASLRMRLERGLAGRYDGLEEIGHGGMAIVFRANDTRHGRLVALKVLRPELAAELSAERFQREIAVEARLNHPNVLTLIDSGQVDGLLFYVASWADEGSLRDRLVRGGTMELTEALRVTAEVGEALAHAHRHGVVHRDVKPENILFRSGHALLADFGIAQVAADAHLSLTHEGLAIGTAHYMSPEQASGDGTVDGRTDQYALACVLFEMLSGDPPFTGRSLRTVIARHLADRPPSLEVVRPDVPLPVVAAVERALSKRAQDRFESIEDFLTVLEPFRSGAHPAEPAVRPRRGWLTVVGALVVVALVFATTRAPGTALAATNIAVLPLEVRGDVRADSDIGIGIAYLIEAALESADPLRLIDIGSELAPAQRSDPEGVPMSEARRLARRANAAWMLRGAIQTHADSVTVILRLFSVTGDSLTRQVSASGLLAQVALHQLGLDALKLLLPYLIENGRAVDLNTLREQSAPAVALWMQGEARYRAAQFGEAADFYARALATDSTFALAALKGAQARGWLHEADASLLLVRQALRFEQRLSPRYRHLARGLRATREGAADSAALSLVAAEAASARWAEASMALGEAQYHLLTRRGAGQRQAQAAFERASAADTNFRPPLFHLAEIAIRDGRTAEAARLVARLEGSGAEPSLLSQLRLMADCLARGVTPEWQRAVAIDPSAGFRAGKALSVGALHMRCAESAFVSVLANPVATEGERWGALLGTVNLRLARGDAPGAQALIDSIVAAGKGVARSQYVLALASSGTMRAPAVALGEFARATFGADFARLRSCELLWVISTLFRISGDSMALRAVNAQLHARADSSGLVRDRMFTRASDAHLALARRDTAAALTVLQALESRSTTLQLAWEPGAALAPDRLLLAQLFLAQGRAREAIEATLVFDHAEPIAFVAFTAPALRVRYLAATRVRDAVTAADARRRLEVLGRQDLLQ